MLFLWILGSVLVWTSAAVLFSRKRGPLTLLNRIGRWFFAVTVIFTVVVWFVVPVAQADRAADATVTAVFPRWYDSAIETWIPNAMLAVAASGAWGATGAGLFFRFKLYSLLGFNWYYLAEVLPWALGAKAHAGYVAGRQLTSYSAGFTDIWPLMVTNAASIVLFLAIYAFISFVERQLGAYTLPRPDAESTA